MHIKTVSGDFDHALEAVGTGVLRADGFDDDETGRFVLEFFGDVLADAGPRVAARALLVGLGDIDLDALPWQMRGQRSATCRAPAGVAAHGRLARIHFHRLGDRATLVGELLERQLQLPRVDALGFLPKEALAENVELVRQRGDFALGFRELLLERGDEGTRLGRSSMASSSARG